VSDLHSLSAALAESIEKLVDDRIAAALEGHAERTPSSPWLSVPEAAKYANVSERAMERLLSSKQLESTTLGRRRLVHRDEIDKYLRGRA
jgi:excisionase family DNA binding protein